MKYLAIGLLAIIAVSFFQPVTNIPKSSEVYAAPVEAAQPEIKSEPVIEPSQPPEPVQQPPVAPVVHTVPANEAKAYIYQHESGNRPDAVNEIGACGLGQALPCSKMPCTLQDYVCQDEYFTGYMQSRYGTWENAYQFWVSHRWW